jgi:hypothetical protein
MNQQYSVLFYSQYSSNCKRILNLIQNSDVDFASVLNLTNVCIDNIQIRDRILKSKNIKINTVPCILTVYPDGGVEKYEGSHTFNLVEEIIEKYNKIQAKQNTQNTLPNTNVTFNNPINTPTINTPTINTPTVNTPTVNTPTVKISQPPIVETKKTKSSISPISEISDLDDENIIKSNIENNDYEEIDTFKEEKIPVDIKKPPKSIRSDSGNYEVGVDFGSYEEPNRDIKKGIKSSTQAVSNTKSDILSAAQAMQKSREMDMESNRPPGVPKEII